MQNKESTIETQAIETIATVQPQAPVEVTARLETLAQAASLAAESASATGKTRKAAYKALQDETLYVLAYGGIKAVAKTRRMFGKEGQFKAFDSMFTDCNGLVRELQKAEGNSFTYKLKSGEAVVASLAKIKAFGEDETAEKALDFSARNAWKNWQEVNASAETETVVNLEDKAMAAAAEASGIDAETLKIASPEEKAELLVQGLLILEEENKAALEQQTAFNQAEVRRFYHLLSEGEKLAFYSEIHPTMAKLVKKNAKARAEEHAEAKAAQAA